MLHTAKGNANIDSDMGGRKGQKSR